MRDFKWKGYLIAAVLVTVLFLCFRKNFSIAGISDALALSGICFLIAALFWTARSLHFYDLIVYGFQKFTNLFKNRNFTQSTSQPYHEFLEGRNYQKSYVECYITAGALLFCSVVMTFWL